MLVPTLRGEAILLPAHVDKNLCLEGGDILHYHYDWWFREGRPNLAAAVRADGDIIWMDLEPVRKEHPHHEGFIFASAILITRYRDKIVKCGKCPHQGVEIGKDGWCPAHGLRWNPDGTSHYKGELYYQMGDVVAKATLPLIVFKSVNGGTYRSIKLMCGDEIVKEVGFVTPMTFFPGDKLRFSPHTLTPDLEGCDALHSSE